MRFATAGPDEAGLAPRAGRVWLWGFLAFSGVFLIHLLWIQQSFDITDEGHHLTIQWLTVANSPYAEYGLIWLTNLAGGVWLQYIAGWQLLSARLGWAVEMGSAGLVAFLVLRRYFSSPAALLGVLATSLAYAYSTLMVINYNNFPALLLTAAAGALLLSQEAGPSRLPRTGFAVLGGSLLGLAMMARFPLLVALVLPFVPPAGKALIARGLPERASWLRAAVSLASAMAAAALCLLFLYGIGRLGEYADVVYTATIAGKYGPEHTTALLLRKFLLTSWASLYRGVQLLLAGAAVAVAAAFASRLLPRRWVPTAVFGVLFYGILYKFVHDPATLPASAYSLILPGIVFPLAGFHLFRAAWRGSPAGPLEENRFLLLAIGTAVAALIPVGSNAGIRNASFGLWFLFPVIFFLFSRPFAGLFSRISRAPAGSSAAADCALVAMIAVGVMGGQVRYVSPYRDYRDRMRFTAQIPHERLRGIYTTAGRAKSVRQVLEEMERRTEPGDVVLAYNYVSMLHYLTRTLPALKTTIPSEMELGRLRAALKALWKRGKPPIVVRAKVNMADRNWGTKAVPEGPPWYVNRKALKILDGEIRRQGYREVWSNRDFAIYAPR